MVIFQGGFTPYAPQCNIVRMPAFGIWDSNLGSESEKLVLCFDLDLTELGCTDKLIEWYSKGLMILYRPWGSMKLVCNFLQTVFYGCAVLLYLRWTSIVL